ncbi:hypothetical protein BV898_17349 [Hypsibius exemplaris]|uniref:Uncharacterized protein n=1 Tax=Hypsibius exemplaris TaxID=2072580 RepID=A0A9X6NFB2_HYPEX|nr:hypothetical protein BV898_17349 [Hypsibius exemplaris]
MALFLNPASKHLPTFTEPKTIAIINLVRSRLAKLLKKQPTADSARVRTEKTSSGIADLLVYADSTAESGMDEIDVYLKLSPPDKTKDLLQLWDDYEQMIPSSTGLSCVVRSCHQHDVRAFI